MAAGPAYAVDGATLHSRVQSWYFLVRAAGCAALVAGAPRLVRERAQAPSGASSRSAQAMGGRQIKQTSAVLCVGGEQLPARCRPFVLRDASLGPLHYDYAQGGHRQPWTDWLMLVP